ncbi:hypothetical protein L7F22_045026, partial [Adiantum nelumboides]|nr:hypothetical protein [Adiantum nelumboides]
MGLARDTGAPTVGLVELLTAATTCWKCRGDAGGEQEMMAAERRRIAGEAATVGLGELDGGDDLLVMQRRVGDAGG